MDEGPGWTGSRRMDVQVAGAAPGDGRSRQSSATIGGLMRTPSVVSDGVVQTSRTSLPMRSARRSLTIEGRLRDGGWGGPGFAQPARQRSPATSAKHRHLRSGLRRPRHDVIHTIFTLALPAGKLVDKARCSRPQMRESRPLFAGFLRLL